MDLTKLDPATINRLWNDGAKEHFWFYVERVHHFKYKHAQHTELICKKLHEVEIGKCKRLMIFLPPRHSKSNTVTESFP